MATSTKQPAKKDTPQKGKPTPVPSPTTSAPTTQARRTDPRIVPK
jgi:hypothetical protein